MLTSIEYTHYVYARRGTHLLVVSRDHVEGDKGIHVIDSAVRHPVILPPPCKTRRMYCMCILQGGLSIESSY
jgi:hypothetical protein